MDFYLDIFYDQLDQQALEDELIGLIQQKFPPVTKDVQETAEYHKAAYWIQTIINQIFPN